MTMPASLRGQRVLVTRPAHQAEPLCQLIEQAGGEAAKLPLIGIEPVGDDDAIAAALQRAATFDGWIFTSANAVRYAALRAPDTWPPAYAIGSATARALAEAGHAPVATPQQKSSSEALLSLDDFQNVAGKRYLIVTGEAGLDTLTRGLTERGAVAEALAVYRRVPLSHTPGRLEAEIRMADAIVITSGESLDHIWALTPEALRPTLLARVLVVPSERVLEKARQYGFADPRVPDEVSDDAILSALTREPADGTDHHLNERMDREPTPTTKPPPRSSEAKPAPSSPAGGSWHGLAWFLVFMLGGALAYCGWLLWEQRGAQTQWVTHQDEALQHLALQTAELQAEAARMDARQNDVARMSQRNGAELASLQARVEEGSDIMGRISEELSGGRARFQLAAVEYVLTLAQDRLQLEHDVAGAIRALEIADARIAALKQPSLFRLRQAIADERAALLAVATPDLTSASLRLSSLIERANQLPLRASISPGAVAALSAPADAVEAPEATWLQQLQRSISGALKSLFVIRRDPNSGALRLIPAEQRAASMEILLLRMEGARAALIRKDSTTYRELLLSAQNWLTAEFDGKDPAVAATVAELQQLSVLELEPVLPETGAALEMLRTAMQTPAP